jgi:hypothetical protein
MSCTCCCVPAWVGPDRVGAPGTVEPVTNEFEAPAGPGWGPPAGPSYPPPANVERPEPSEASTADLRVAARITVGLAVLGALLGLLWSTWSGPQQRAYVISPGKLYPYDEVETMAGGDGRYLIIVVAVGLIAALLAWILRPGNRGPLVLLALCIGGLAGAVLTAWIGHLTGGGTFDGKTNTIIKHLPLSLHMRGLLFVEPAVSALIYGLFVAFASRDDLGRHDAVRERVSVGAGDHAQYGGGYGDAPGPLQQRDLPTQ